MAKTIKRDYKKGDKIITSFNEKVWDKGTVISCDGITLRYKDDISKRVHFWNVEFCRLEEK